MPHFTPIMLIGKFNRTACFANKICLLKYAAQKRAWKDIPTCWNWFNEVFYRKVHRRTYHCLWTMFQGFSKREFCGVILNSQCNKLETVMRFGVIPAVKKIYKCLLLKDVLSFYQIDNGNQQLLK